MCGIIGYTGKKKAMPLLMQGLKMLEYRGYDSSGIALAGQNEFKVYKKMGKLENLEAIVPRNAAALSGIGHTRWATHGGVTDANAHPHAGYRGKAVVVHNGIIDNYLELKQELQGKGANFLSETDTEVIAQLVEHYLVDQKMTPENAVLTTLGRLEGTYGLGVMFADHPGLIIGAKNGSPMVLGLGDKEVFLASDASSFAGLTRQVVYLQDKEIAILKPESWETRNLRNEAVFRNAEELTWNHEEAKKGDYDHFFLKEIFEQPQSVARAFGQGGRLVPEYGTAKLGGLNLDKREFFDIERVVFIGMGTALNAAQVGARMMESWARLPARAEDASEIRTGNPIVERNTLYFAVSQSGETADTIASIHEIQEKGGRVLGIVNTVGSSLARMCNGGVYIHAGPEISVASSKAFTNQLVVMGLIALFMGRMRVLSLTQGQAIVKEFGELPEKLQAALGCRSQIMALAKKYRNAKSMLFLGRGIMAPLAMEGALKLKEISYIHAEGYAAGNLKHGPLALISPEVPSVFIVANSQNLDRVVGNMAEVKARKGPVICVSNIDTPKLRNLADDLIIVPETCEELAPVVAALPLQLFAYYLAMELDRDIDRPRNLAKSVTTE
jgi:glucosamine--fructose-6-phosphate aminotransferase (isomerizing)